MTILAQRIAWYRDHAEAHAQDAIFEMRNAQTPGYFRGDPQYAYDAARLAAHFGRLALYSEELAGKAMLVYDAATQTPVLCEVRIAHGEVLSR